jgi:hypothetical protein
MTSVFLFPVLVYAHSPAACHGDHHARFYQPCTLHVFCICRAMQVAGLPPVTKDWFEARKVQLSTAATSAPNAAIWFDPLTKKKFQTQNTYQVRGVLPHVL